MNIQKKANKSVWLFSLWMGVSLVAHADGSDDKWHSANRDLENTASNLDEDKINKHNVKDLKILWEYLTAPDTNTPEGALGNVSSTPSVTQDKVFFTDWSGNVTALDRQTGTLLWKKNLLNDISIDGHIMNYSRNTPVYSDGKVIIGESYLINAPLCEANELPANSLGCVKGDGATIVALDEDDGSVIWRKKVETHPASKVTGSVSIHNNVVYVPVASWEEDFSRNHTDPDDSSKPYPCCSFRGSIVALDLDNGHIQWRSYTSIGHDPDNLLAPEVRALLTEDGGIGYYGVSSYGHGPTIDTQRNSIYYATAQTYTTPKKGELCEVKRRDKQKANVNIKGFPKGVNCNNLNEKLKTYGNAIVSLDKSNGDVKWAFYARQYDAWNHACDAPDLSVGGIYPPILVPLPLSNKDNCPSLVGPDMGFGHQPMLIKNVMVKKKDKKSKNNKKGKKHKKIDLVVAANKDGRLFAINADDGQLVWETPLELGNIYGGAQFGIATDGKRIFVPTVNGSNVNRDKDLPFVSAQTFRDDNGFTALGLRGGLFVARDGDPGSDRSGPGPFLPFPAPHIFYGPAGSDYAGFVPDLLVGPISGPKNRWALVNPPSDVPVDNQNVFYEGGKLRTVAGMITAVDAATGEILWQRPAVDGVSGQLSIASAIGSIAVTKDIVFAGYLDTKGTFVALDSASGEKLFQFNAKIDSDGQGTMISNGGIEGGPAIVDGVIYLGIGGGTSGAFAPPLAGNRVYALTIEDEDSDSSSD